MLSRDLGYVLKRTLKLPVIIISGPKGSGKTTLVKTLLKNHKYVSCEDVDTRLFAINDPAQFLNFYKNDYGVIVDEAQHAPALFLQIQAEVAQQNKPGYFILVSSEKLPAKLTQPLTTSRGMLTLLPFSLKELLEQGKIDSVDVQILAGCYPQVFEDKTAQELYPVYIRSFIERELPSYIHTKNIPAFYKFMQLCAGHVGQLLNLDTLGEECGISFATARQWLTVLENHFFIFLLPAHTKAFNKRVTKTPKLYFYDTGIACTLLRITQTDVLSLHPLRGKLFENFIIADLHKQFLNTGQQPKVYFWRDQNGRYDIDCLIESDSCLYALEISSGITLTEDSCKKLAIWSKISQAEKAHNFLIYTGSEKKERESGTVMGWQQAADFVEILM